MSIRFAINGFGRIGRCLARISRSRPDLELSAVNDLAPASSLARLLRRDSIHGRFAGQVEALGDDQLVIDDRSIAVHHRTLPGEIPWRDVEIVVEATGKATDRASAAGHLRPRGARRVLISAVAEDADLMVCLGVNETAFDPLRHFIVSNASCTTNCLALLLRVLHEDFGVERALMSEAHSYTGNQVLVDGLHADPRRGRAAAINIVPTTTAAPRAIERLMPDLAGRIAGQAIRVPTPDVALLDLVAVLKVPIEVEQIRSAFVAAAQGRLLGLLTTSTEPLVSSDFVGDSHSAIVDLELIQVADRNLVRVMAWYDNEWGYAHRLADLLTLLGAKTR